MIVIGCKDTPPGLAPLLVEAILATKGREKEKYSNVDERRRRAGKRKSWRVEGCEKYWRKEHC